MEADEQTSRVVLVVEDERNLADLYATWLSDQYEVRTAYDGEAAVELVDDAVDVVLLDRRLPGMSGDEFLDYVEEQGYDCQVAMVSAVDPDFDILEMGFDDYLVKPVERGELHRVVERLMSLESTGTETQDYFAAVAKKEALENEKTEQDLEAHEGYAGLLRTIDDYSRRVLSLAEDYLESEQSGTGVDYTAVYRKGIEKWRDRQRGLDETDPLYRTAQNEIERYERQLDEQRGGSTARRELLEAVASGFVPEGFWLDERVRRALNDILFDKRSAEFVIQRKRLDPDVSLSPEQYFDVSQAVRERARDELDAA